MDYQERGIQDMRLIPPGPGKCRECAVQHDPGEPHDQQSLYYQMKFRQQHGRFPSWRDAMAHCNPDVQALWIHLLAEEGVQVPEVEPKENAPNARNT